MNADEDRLLSRYANPHGAAVRITGPEPFTTDVGALRVEIYRSHMPYLLADDALRVDERAAHFCARGDDGSLVGALRVTTETLELPRLSVRCADLAAALPHYGEISRVVIRPCHRNRALPARLFAAMAQWMMRESQAEGLVALSRERVLPFYRRFGFAPIHTDPLSVDGRPHHDYRVIAATFATMMESAKHRLGRHGLVEACVS